MDAAKKLDKKGETLKVVVNELESDTSGIDKGTWILDFDYVIGKKSVKSKTQTAFTSAFAGDTACRNTAVALEDALRENFLMFARSIEKKTEISVR